MRDMSGNRSDRDPKPKDTEQFVKETGFAHFLSATRYSIAGMRVLLKEAAFRHEISLAIAMFASLIFVGASSIHLIFLLVLVLILFAIEALNTAIETIVDKLSPERSEFAKQTKDLGSFAVACLILGVLAYYFYVLLETLNVIN